MVPTIEIKSNDTITVNLKSVKKCWLEFNNNIEIKTHWNIFIFLFII